LNYRAARFAAANVTLFLLTPKNQQPPEGFFLVLAITGDFTAFSAAKKIREITP
jgi:hypothetical protein